MADISPALTAITDQWNASLRDMDSEERLQFAAVLLFSALDHIMCSRATGRVSLPLVLGHLAMANDSLSATAKVLPAPTSEQTQRFESTASLIPQAVDAMARAGIKRGSI